MGELHYAVLIGDAGTGKSTLSEKISGISGQSSDAKESFTTKSMMFRSGGGEMIVSDTPGSNAMRDKLEHNMQIAAALNWGPVSRIFLVVKADTRIDTTVDQVRKYAEQLAELDSDVLAVIVTHMDGVTWTDRDFTPALSGELGLDTVIFSSPARTGEQLVADMLRVCKTRFNLSVDEETFFRLFKIHNNNLKILRSAKKEIELFKAIKREFDRQRPSVEERYKADLLFEFQAFMAAEIIKAQQRVAAENNFTFYGDGAANQAGHIANMTNQLRAILYDIRLETLSEGASDHGVNELRKCPHCGLVWAKIVGCEGETTCGSRVGSRDANNNGIMATFTFQIRFTDMLESFSFIKAGEYRAEQPSSSSALHHAGCGASITWSQMRLVSVPLEFQEGTIDTSDVSVIPAGARGIAQNVGRKIRKITQNMSFAS